MATGQGSAEAAGKKFRCPYCGGRSTRVFNTRPMSNGEAVRRQRRCQNCGKQLITVERLQIRLKVRDEARDEKPLAAYDEQRLKRSIQRCLEDQDQGAMHAEVLLSEIQAELLKLPGKEVSKAQLIQLVEAKLQALNPQLAERYRALRPLLEPLPTLEEGEPDPDTQPELF